MLTVTTADAGMLDLHIMSVLEVNAVSVWAILWRRNCDVPHLDPS